jgi:hypothetical protein
MPQQVGDPIAEAAQVQEQVFILIHIKGTKVVLLQVTAPVQSAGHGEHQTTRIAAKSLSVPVYLSMMNRSAGKIRLTLTVRFPEGGYSEDITMNKLLAILSLLALFQSSVRADFSGSEVILHPRFPATEPFIIEISGTWPSDCHPGEQKPVVESWDGQTVAIDFEIIVVHITCNEVDTVYRVLVDMSDSIRTTKPIGDTLQVQVNFQGEKGEQTLGLVCPKDDGCPNMTIGQQGPDPGLYYAPGLMSQGLLVARQNAATAIYPLVYDKFGRSRWLFAGNLMTEDTFFSEILEFSGGDCFGCDPTGATPDRKPVGYLTVLADRSGVIQVKVNDGLFSEYSSLVYGYQTFAVGPTGEQTLVDLEGRWGISENHGTDPPLGDLTEFLPGAFDIQRENIVTAVSGIQQQGQVSYLLNTPTGETLGQLVCKGQTAADGVTGLCEFIDPTDAAEPLFLFYQLGPSRLGIDYGRSVIAIGQAPGGQAVRLE